MPTTDGSAPARPHTLQMGTVQNLHVTKPVPGLRYALLIWVDSSSLQKDTLFSVLLDIGCPRRADSAI